MRNTDRQDVSFALILLAYVVLLLLFGETSPKKQDRYLLPLFPILDLLAAIGWVWLFDMLSRLTNLSRWSEKAKMILPTTCILAQAAFTLPHYPYYQT